MQTPDELLAHATLGLPNDAIVHAAIVIIEYTSFELDERRLGWSASGGTPWAYAGMLRSVGLDVDNELGSGIDDAD
jgi:hypothetical protein